MKLSQFGEKFAHNSGILELMEDLGEAAVAGDDICMLGGGNPAHIGTVMGLMRDRMKELLSGDDFDKMLSCYGSSRGEPGFKKAVAELLAGEYGWDITEKNVAVVNSSQCAFFYFFNMFSGLFPNGTEKKILFPLCPEYIGYADQGIKPGAFASRKPKITLIDKHTYKYNVDFSQLNIDESVGALCVSRPTNPTGNVMTDSEIRELGKIAEGHDIPLLIDSAYGLPFPNIVYEDVRPFWNRNTILSMSLSKLGLPAARTGIIVADEKIIDSISGINAIISLSTGKIGQTLALRLFESGKILDLCRDVIQPFYREKSCRTVGMIHQAFDGIDYAVHKSEGAFFLWIWFRNLKITSRELYERLKKRKVLVIPSRYFFFGLGEEWSHRDECIRLNFAQDDDTVRKGIEIIADEARKAGR